MGAMAEYMGIPDFRDLMHPTLNALKGLGGSARIDEISAKVISDLGFTEEQQAIRRNADHHMSLIDYRLAWARNYLKNIGAVVNSARGVWAITEHGRSLDPDQIRTELRAYKAAYNAEYQKQKRAQHEIPDDDDDDMDTVTTGEYWKDELLDVVQKMSPDGFERLAQRLLREANFRSVEVLGKSGDGGLDGVGILGLSLVSFPVFFQCKRYQGSVGPSAVRDFRGAMSGRGEKGLLMTTGTFTKDAKAEATRDGAPPVELIDGESLCDLLKQYELGVAITLRTVEDIEVIPSFFEDV
jgi:restriction system protein